MPTRKENPAVSKMFEGYATPSDLAAALGVGSRTISRWRADGLAPPSIKLGRTKVLFPLDGVEEWLRGRNGSAGKAA